SSSLNSVSTFPSFYETKKKTVIHHACQRTPQSTDPRSRKYFLHLENPRRRKQATPLCSGSARTSACSPFGQEPLVLLQNIAGVGHHLPDSVDGQEPLRPRRQARELGLVEQVGAGHLVHHLDPHQMAPERDVDEPRVVPAEEGLPLGALPERSLQRLHARDDVLERLSSLLRRQFLSAVLMSSHYTVSLT
ncbi:Os01g0692050, partial [Oryza sativa Japonica Group]